MSKLIKCTDCDKEISKRAKSCPGCGAKNPRSGFWVKALLIIFFTPVLISVLLGGGQPPAAQVSNIKEEQACKEAIRKSLQYPSSFDESFGSTASARNNDGAIAVEFNFEAKNGFGAVLPQTGRCIIKDGQIVLAQTSNR